MAALERDMRELDLGRQEKEKDAAKDVDPKEKQGAAKDAEPKKKDILPFFKLPRELRDKIYVEATTDIWVELYREPYTWDNVTDSALLEGAPCPHLSLISRQMKQEYEEEMKKPSETAKLTVGLRELARGRWPHFWHGRRAMARVRELALTHHLHTGTATPGVLVRNTPTEEYEGFVRLEHFLLSRMPSLRRLSFVHMDTVDGFEIRQPAKQYRPWEFTSAKVRRLINLHSRRPLNDNISIVCSVVLTGFLVSPMTDPEWGPDHPYYTNPLNRIVYHAPATLDPRNWDLLAFVVDQSETSTIEAVDQYGAQVDDYVLEPRVWLAGYRKKVGEWNPKWKRPCEWEEARKSMVREKQENKADKEESPEHKWKLEPMGPFVEYDIPQLKLRK